MIKNRIFDVVNDVEPADFAEEKWKATKEILTCSDTDVPFEQFYRHFWISKYKKSSYNKLYDDFKAYVTPKNKERYKKFLTEMEYSARLYVKIINPQISDFAGRKEYMSIVQSLNAITNYFNIIQARVALMALLEAKEKNLLTLKHLKKIIFYIENFHFAYNAVCAKPTNKLEKIYSDFAISLRKCNDKANAKTIIDGLTSQLDSIYISYNDFESRFVLLSYTNKDKNASYMNVKTKYAINKIATWYGSSEIFYLEGSVEHVLPENEDVKNINIGNLILLETKLNEEADAMSYIDKINIYKKSSYKWVDKFIEENSDWTFEKVSDRAKKLAELYYTKILCKNK